VSRSRIQPDSITPISEQLRQLLLREIADGHFAAGARIPSERDMAVRYGVSRTSVRDCIARLITEKVLMRSKRRGTFVAPPAPAGTPEPSRTGLVGYLVNKALMEFFHSRYSRILSGVEECLHQKGLHLVFHSCGDDHRSAALKGLQRSGRLALDGCIVAGRVRRETLETLRSAAVPAVIVDREAGAGDLVSVQADYARGTCLAMEHLRELGHTRIGFIGFADSQKYRAYCEAGKRFRIAHDPNRVEFLEIFDLPPAILAGYQTTQRLIASGHLPTALLVR
jgi:DNA-binding LacI/PurR family transcriptional regulator